MSAQPVRRANQAPSLSPAPKTSQNDTADPYPCTRFLGPSLQLRHPHRRRDGHAERSRDVRMLRFPAPRAHYPIQYTVLDLV